MSFYLMVHFPLIIVRQFTSIKALPSCLYEVSIENQLVRVLKITLRFKSFHTGNNGTADRQLDMRMMTAVHCVSFRINLLYIVDIGSITSFQD